MAIELTRKRLTELAKSGQSLTVPPHILAGAAAAIIAISLTSLVIGIRDAHRAETAAQTRFADAQALLALKPIDTTALQIQVDQAKQDLASEQKIAAASQIDPLSDTSATLLVRHSESVGLTVKGITRNTPAISKLGDVSYNVQGIRVTVEGATWQITALLDALHKEEPSLIPVLASMTIATNGTARADVGFNVYDPIATPTVKPRAAATPKASR